MGSSQSTRKLTINNDEDDANVIRISDSVAQRLANEQSKQSDKQEVASPAVRTAREVELSHTAHPHFTISALEMQQQKERELQEQETYYQRRLQNLEKTHEKINTAIDTEYKKALTIFDDCKVIKAQDAVKPCIENRQKVLKCYQENPRETLRCASLVEEFSSCVDQRRAQLMRCN
ncbi:MICOS complex subunit mic25a [Trichogramma pretiosum]|uniref:MICOS complex subunit MIC19 n=1 Tax=Trichogramma kaykai TaxID=54128 RepID=A0ABD2XEC5_9HYME|nr:MICOS complex subunit mic25a [Trichogramma pretiosum]XP_014231354.1 MICOS complex subunit mic25a [Trichogramma pretiosum]XP_014231364.1 MICOS complex subunit mic25a [Trichogramma pretiosum]